MRDSGAVSHKVDRPLVYSLNLFFGFFFMGSIVKSLTTDRWRGEGGYAELLHLAGPLILSTGAISIQHFVDRIFLTWYSPETIAAVTPAGIVSFTIESLFIGIAIYVTTFVAQYYGAGHDERIGPVIWQGMYVACIAGVFHLLIMPFAGVFFGAVGHGALVCRYETRYFQILCLGAAPAVWSTALSGFYSGQSRTLPVMWVNVAATGINMFLDYVLIFGKLGFPELGISGAAIATVSSFCFACAVYCALIFRRKYDKRFHTLRGWRFERDLFSRLMRYGFPNGVQFFIDVAGFAVFILLIGRMGTVNLAATNIAFNISALAFMPMIGFGRAVSIIVGQKIGEGKPDIAERSTYNGFILTFTYMASIAVLYVAAPWLFLAPFAAHANGGDFGPISRLAVILLRFVAFYSLFDALNIIFASAIRGAGDTRFVMLMITVMSVGVLIIPSYIAMVVFNAHIYTGWAIATAYVSLLGIVFLIRFRGGKWKSMKVIEYVPHAVSPILPEAPAAEMEP